MVTLVGVRGFEPPASTSRTWRASQAALHPDGAGKEPIGTRQFPLTAQPAFGDRCLPGFVYCELKWNKGAEGETAFFAMVQCRGFGPGVAGRMWRCDEHK